MRELGMGFVCLQPEMIQVTSVHTLLAKTNSTQFQGSRKDSFLHAQKGRKKCVYTSSGSQAWLVCTYELVVYY